MIAQHNLPLEKGSTKVSHRCTHAHAFTRLDSCHGLPTHQPTTSPHCKLPLQALFKQLFSFVNVNLFNQLLLRRECCSFSNGEHVRTGLSQVEGWIVAAGPDVMGDSWDELRFIRNVSWAAAETTCALSGMWVWGGLIVRNQQESIMQRGVPSVEP
eukprot:362627-Chlamydomonas_euryale.AAC.7